MYVHDTEDFYVLTTAVLRMYSHMCTAFSQTTCLHLLFSSCCLQSLIIHALQPNTELLFAVPNNRTQTTPVLCVPSSLSQCLPDQLGWLLWSITAVLHSCTSWTHFITFTHSLAHSLTASPCLSQVNGCSFFDAFVLRSLNQPRQQASAMNPFT